MKRALKKTWALAAASALTIALLAACEKPTSLLGGNSPSETLLGIRASLTGGPVSINRMLPCPDGGSLTMHGAAPNETNRDGTGRLVLNVVLRPEHCRWKTADGMMQLDGTPNLVLHGSRDVVHGMFAKQINGTLKGKASWTVAGRAVSCRVDAAYQIDLRSPLTPTINGQECEKYLIKRFFGLE